MSFQGHFPNKDGFVYGLLRSRLNSELLRSDEDIDGEHLKQLLPGHVPSRHFPGNRMVFVNGCIFEIETTYNIFTIIPLTGWQNDGRGVGNLDAVIKYLILCIYDAVPPSIANVIKFQIYLYTDKPVTFNGFEYTNTYGNQSALLSTFATQKYQYIMFLSFDNKYNTRYIKAPQCDIILPPHWRKLETLHGNAMCFDPKGLTTEPGEPYSPFGEPTSPFR